MLLGCPTIQCHLPVHPCFQPRVTHSHGTKRQSKLCVLASFSPVRFFLLPIKFLTFSHQNSLKNNAFPSPTPRVSQVAQRVIALGAKVTLGSWKQPCVCGNFDSSRVHACPVSQGWRSRVHAQHERIVRSRSSTCENAGNTRERATPKRATPKGLPPVAWSAHSCAHDARSLRAARTRRRAPQGTPG